MTPFGGYSPKSRSIARLKICNEVSALATKAILERARRGHRRLAVKRTQTIAQNVAPEPSTLCMIDMQKELAGNCTPLVSRHLLSWRRACSSVAMRRRRVAALLARSSWWSGGVNVRSIGLRSTRRWIRGVGGGRLLRVQRLSAMALRSGRRTLETLLCPYASFRAAFQRLNITIGCPTITSG